MASDTDIPTTSGTGTGAGPCEMVTAIVVPCGVGPVGAHDTTWPLGTVSLYWLVQVILSPRAVSAAVAPAQVEPVSDGAVTMGGPEETTTDTVEPSGAWPLGLQSMTVPWVSDREFWCVQATLRPWAA